MSGNEMKYINDAFDHNWVAPLGSNVDGLEGDLARYSGVGHAAALSSGTAALHLALIILGIKPGDEVIASTFTFAATINPIIYQGATPIFIDSEPGTWNMDPHLLEKAIRERIMAGKKPKAIIPVHIYGMPANMEAIMNIADRYDIPVIGDAAEALGSRFKGKPVTSYGKMSILSFNGNKIITTSGGGALVSDDEDMIARARFLATQAKDNAPYYQHSTIGYNYRMSNIVAGIGRGQMEVIDERVKQRRNNYYYYKEALSSFEWMTFMEEPGKEYFSNHWLTAVLLDPVRTGTTPLIVQNELESMNIESRSSWKPMHLQPVFEKYPAYLNGTSDRIFFQGLCLPSGSNMTMEDLEFVSSNLIKCLSSHVRRKHMVFAPVSVPVDAKAV